MFSPDRFCNLNRNINNRNGFNRTNNRSNSISEETLATTFPGFINNNLNNFQHSTASKFSPAFARTNQPKNFAKPADGDSNRPVIPLRTVFRTTIGSGSKVQVVGSKFESGRKTLSEPATPGLVLKDRGLRPSDLSDPHKKEFLTNLTNRVFHLALVSNSELSKYTAVTILHLV